MKRSTWIYAMLAALAAPVHARLSATDHAAHHPAQAQNAATLTDGEVRKIDFDAGKITIRHGPIQNLDMPGMTMVFQVREHALLDKVKPGDKIKFHVEKVGSAYVVTQIEPAM